MEFVSRPVGMAFLISFFHATGILPRITNLTQTELLRAVSAHSCTTSSGARPITLPFHRL